MPGPDARLAAALAAGESGPASRAELLASFVDATVLAGVTATATGLQEGPRGLTAESGAELAVLLLEAADGSRALPVFSDVQQLRRWRIDARPVPMTGAQACQAAVDDAGGHVVLDPAGAAIVLDLAEVTALAQGWVPVPGSNLSSRRVQGVPVVAADVDPQLLMALRAALADEPIRAARLLAGDDGLVLGICPQRPLDASGLAALAQRVVDRLGDRMPPEGMQLTQVARQGPGREILHRRRLFAR